MPIGTNDAITITAMIGSTYLSMLEIVDPSPYPASVSPTAQISPPMTCQSVNVRVETSSAPTMGFSTVRTTGMNRANIMAFPYP